MFWILQDNLINVETRDGLADLLTRSQTSFAKVRLVPFFNLLDGEIPHVTGQVFVYGSTGLGQVAKNWGGCRDTSTKISITS